jgi:hypothetical protein
MEHAMHHIRDRMPLLYLLLATTVAIVVVANSAGV